MNISTLVSEHRATNAARAYIAKHPDDEVARRGVEGTCTPPRDADELPIVPLSRLMDDWLDASAVELIDGPLIFTWDDDGEDWP